MDNGVFNGSNGGHNLRVIGPFGGLSRGTTIVSLGVGVLGGIMNNKHKHDGFSTPDGRHVQGGYSGQHQNEPETSNTNHSSFPTYSERQLKKMAKKQQKDLEQQQKDTEKQQQEQQQQVQAQPVQTKAQTQTEDYSTAQLFTSTTSQSNQMQPETDYSTAQLFNTSSTGAKTMANKADRGPTQDVYNHAIDDPKTLHFYLDKNKDDQGKELGLLRANVDKSVAANYFDSDGNAKAMPDGNFMFGSDKILMKKSADGKNDEIYSKVPAEELTAIDAANFQRNALAIKEAVSGNTEKANTVYKNLHAADQDVSAANVATALNAVSSETGLGQFKVISENRVALESGKSEVRTRNRDQDKHDDATKSHNQFDKVYDNDFKFAKALLGNNGTIKFDRNDGGFSIDPTADAGKVQQDIADFQRNAKAIKYAMDGDFAKAHAEYDLIHTVENRGKKKPVAQQQTTDKQQTVTAGFQADPTQDKATNDMNAALYETGLQFKKGSDGVLAAPAGKLGDLNNGAGPSRDQLTALLGEPARLGKILYNHDNNTLIVNPADTLYADDISAMKANALNIQRAVGAGPDLALNNTVDKTAADKTATDKTTTDKTAADKTTTDKTTTDKTVADKTTTDKTTTDKTTTDNTIAAEAVPTDARNKLAEAQIMLEALHNKGLLKNSIDAHHHGVDGLLGRDGKGGDTGRSIAEFKKTHGMAANATMDDATFNTLTQAFQQAEGLDTKGVITANGAKYFDKSTMAAILTEQQNLNTNYNVKLTAAVSDKTTEVALNTSDVKYDFKDVDGTQKAPVIVMNNKQDNGTKSRTA